eukprot:TRINITY_DN2033_c0_g2_i1.p1 TRINITY_DN2033_c0_g2~~TRINITY_DN2033_c0_g2_i1.p1  ORF type:complete len:442 (-),score=41.68 TRINITY_DN2033_c0_g2_i1:542-1867(-)
MLTRIPSFNPVSLQYTEADLLGEGGFGKVYRAQYHGHTEIKVTSSDGECSEEKQNQLYTRFSEFKHEAKLMLDLLHPNIVRLLGITTFPLRMVMELAQYGDLYHLLYKGETKLKSPLRKKIIIDMLKGLKYLHSQSPPVVHRDLRSPNVFIHSLNPSDPVVAKLADFGLSQRLLPTASGFLGTWQWVAPEAQSDICTMYDERSDIYSAGIVMNELVSRRRPFDELYTSEKYSKEVSGKRMLKEQTVKRAIVEEGLRPNIKSSCSPELRIWIHECWQNHPPKRPSAIFLLKRISIHFGLTVAPEPEEQVQNLKLSLLTPKPITIGAHKVWSMAWMPPKIWVGTSNGLLVVYGPESACLKYVCLKSTQLHNSRIYALTPVEANIWCSSETGAIFIVSQETFQLQREVDSSTRSLFLYQVCALHCRSSGMQFSYSKLCNKSRKK